MTAAEVLVDAWARWDELPRDTDRANRMEDACIDVAGEHGLASTVLRARLVERRRTHRRDTYRDTLAHVLGVDGR